MIRSGAAPSSPDTRQGARALLVSARTANLDLAARAWDVGVSSQSSLTTHSSPFSNLQILAWVDWIERQGWREAFLFLKEPSPIPLIAKSLWGQGKGGPTMEKTNVKLQLPFPFL